MQGSEQERDSDFNFDCPQAVLDIALALRQRQVCCPEHVVDEWFTQSHPLHQQAPPRTCTAREEEPRPADDIANTTKLNRRSSTSSVPAKRTINAIGMKSKSSSISQNETESVKKSAVDKGRVTRGKILAPRDTLKRSERLKPSAKIISAPPISSSSPPRKVSVEMKSFPAAPKTKPNVKMTARVTSSRSEKLEEYRQQKIAAKQNEDSKNFKRSLSAGTASKTGRPKKKHLPSDQSIDEKENSDMLSLLKQHNKKFQPVALYEPSRHSVRDVRKWEKKSGKTWSSLRPEEREMANNEILMLKENKL